MYKRQRGGRARDARAVLVELQVALLVVDAGEGPELDVPRAARHERVARLLDRGRAVAAVVAVRREAQVEHGRVVPARAAQQLAAQGQREAGALLACVRHTLEADKLLKIEYVSLCDPRTLLDVDQVSSPTRLAIAVWIGDVRLIDNCLVT